MERRTLPLQKMEKREADDGKIFLEGYFARFNEPYEVCSGWVETIAPGAFARYLATDGDVKALWNHNHDLVLGSRTAGTLELFEDDHGLRGRVEINQKDSDALNAYARIDRGDVSGCSFGFDAVFDEFTDADGTYRTVIREVSPLYEVSPCTFPAYESTSIEARARLDERKQAREKELHDWRERQMVKLKK